MIEFRDAADANMSLYNRKLIKDRVNFEVKFEFFFLKCEFKLSLTKSIKFDASVSTISCGPEDVSVATIHRACFEKKICKNIVKVKFEGKNIPYSGLDLGFTFRIMNAFLKFISIFTTNFMYLVKR
ncbi:hypothetical protein BpHYR1_011746 [Brachionus plicatilis]|uniref:Uncharacterized protein n=1 Tax=Brachionus plicatilis TaxID=10195 RepID=A0A3M7P8D2_BRAPC|nr:hypothetical protein BpHYR1_011746 [Brachionus plicatilis]